MIHVHCPACSIWYFVGTGSIAMLHNTDNGPVAEMSCPEGHHLLHRFRSPATVAVGG